MIFILLLAIISLSIVNLKIKGGYSWKDIFSPTRWKHVYIFILKKHLRWLDTSEQYISRNKLLQYAYRVASCGDCVQNGKCLHCKCDIEGKLNAITDHCSLNKWGAMLSDEEMNTFLKNNELEFTVNIKEK